MPGPGDVDWCTAAVIGPEMQAGLDRVAAARIPIEVFFENAQVATGP